MRKRCARTEHQGKNIDREQFVKGATEGCPVNVFECTSSVGDAGVPYEDIQLAPAINGSLDRGEVALPRGHVSHDRLHGTSQIRCRVQDGGRAVHGDHPCSLVHEPAHR